MIERGLIFLNFTLPNGTTWFYFSLLLAVGLFFKFTRFLSIRNWDLLTLFLMVPGLLLLHEAHVQSALVFAGRWGSLAGLAPGVPLGGLVSIADAMEPSPVRPLRGIWYAYLWLLAGSLYFFVRCLLDLVLVRRPALSPNLNLSGLAWLGGAFFVFLATVAFRQSGTTDDKIGKASAALDQAQKRAEDLVNQQTGTGLSGPGTRFWVERTLAMLCHLAVVVGLLVIGCRHFQDATAGMAMATLYLMVPFTAYHVGQVHHVWPMALMTWTVVAYRKPFWSGVLLGLAAGSVYFPVLVFPTWCSFYWRRGAGRFATAFALAAGLSLAVLGLALWLDGELSRSVRTALLLSDWQPWRAPTAEGFWLGMDGGGVHWAYRIPVFSVYLAFVAATAFWPAPKNLAHVLALSTAVLIGIQFWYADQGGVYVLWYLPYLLLVFFRPNLSDRVPPIPLPGRSRFVALARRLARFIVRRFKLPEPLTPATPVG